jgi:hypothetical protein
MILGFVNFRSFSEDDGWIFEGRKDGSTGVCCCDSWPMGLRPSLRAALLVKGAQGEQGWQVPARRTSRQCRTLFRLFQFSGRDNAERTASSVRSNPRME